MVNINTIKCDQHHQHGHIFTHDCPDKRLKIISARMIYHLIVRQIAHAWQECDAMILGLMTDILHLECLKLLFHVHNTLIKKNELFWVLDHFPGWFKKKKKKLLL